MRTPTRLADRLVRLLVAIVTLLSGAGAARAQFMEITYTGLSSVRSALFHNEDLFFYGPEAGDHFAGALATGDFNGDGAEDLATGIPDDDGLIGAPIGNIGAVVIRYGTPRGLDTGIASTVLNQLAGGSPDAAEGGERLGYALASCDFNGDAFDDLAIGAPFDDAGANGESAGAVQVHYGGPGGIGLVAQQFLTQSTQGIPGEVDGLDAFGAALACGDFDADGFDDLAIGVPEEDDEHTLDITRRVGTVVIVLGSPTGLDPAQSGSFDQDTTGMAGSSDTEDYFGTALAVGDFDGDGHDDLAIGVPGEDNSGIFENNGKGAVHVLFGGDSGIGIGGNVLFMESNLGGTPELGDHFGAALAAGDFDGDGNDDLAIGVPGEDLGGLVDCGNVGEVFGSASGLDFARSQGWDEDRIFAAGYTETDDRFGQALAAGDFDRDGFIDLAIGHPGEDYWGTNDGAVSVLVGSPGFGLTGSRDLQFGEGFAGYPGDANQHDRDFGFALAVGDFDGNGHADLAVGAPWQNGTAVDEGAEMVVYGALFADGFEEGLIYWALFF